MGVDPVTLGIGAGAQIIGGLVGQEEARRGQEDAAKTRGQARALIDQLQIPDIEKQKLEAEMLQYVGDYRAEKELEKLLGPSAMEQVSVDPRLKNAQMEVLENLGKLSKSGMTPVDLAELELNRRRAASESQAQMNAILQQRQQRGLGGSGDELAARLAASQAGIDRMAEADLATAGRVSEARKQAMREMGQAAFQTRGQEFNEQSDVARAKDIVNQFNVQNAQNVQMRNIAEANRAQRENLSNRQDIMNRNVDLRNKQQEYNKKLLQQDFENRFRKASVQSGAVGQEANIRSNEASQRGAGIAGVGQGLGNMLVGIGNTKLRQDELAERERSRMQAYGPERNYGDEY